MTTILIACGSALAATLIVVVAYLLGRRAGGSADAKLNALGLQIDERMQAMVRELSEALERAQEENRRSRVLAELAGAIELDEVIARTLDVTGSLSGVDAVVVAVESGEEGLLPPAGRRPPPTNRAGL